MLDDNKKNLHYFEATSMRALYDTMEHWQEQNRKRLLSVSIQNDGGKFCCIALTNPTEVVITDSSGISRAGVEAGRLLVYTRNG